MPGKSFETVRAVQPGRSSGLSRGDKTPGRTDIAPAKPRNQIREVLLDLAAGDERVGELAETFFVSGSEKSRLLAPCGDAGS